MIGQMAIAIALSGFNSLGRSVTPIFLLVDHFDNYFAECEIGVISEGGEKKEKTCWREKRKEEKTNCTFARLCVELSPFTLSNTVCLLNT